MKHILIVAVFPVIILSVFISRAAHRSDFLYNNTQIGFAKPDTVVPVKIQLVKRTMKDMQVLFIPDTASNNEMIHGVLDKGYGELMQFLQQNKLTPLRFIAWYYTVQPPWSMDVAVETSGIPSQLTGRIQKRTVAGGEVIVAQMWGPYDQVGQGYEKIERWLIENKRKAKGNPFEVYLNDPAAVKSPSEIRTDIYQPIE